MLGTSIALCIETIAAAAGADKKIARVMPNTLSLSGNGYSAVCLTENCSEDDAQIVDEMLNALGQVMHIGENMFDTFTGFSCTGPLWIYKMIEAMTDAGVYSGFARADARDIVIRNMIGAATVLSMTGEHPAVKVDQIDFIGRNYYRSSEGAPAGRFRQCDNDFRRCMRKQSQLIKITIFHK